MLMLILLIVKVLAALVVAVICLAAVLHYRAMHNMNFYKDQGAMVFPGSDRFFIGLLSRFRQW